MPVVEAHEDSVVLQAESVVTYRIRFVDNLLDTEPDERDLWCVKRSTSRRRLVFVSDSIDRLYGDRLRACFSRHGLECTVVRVSSGERSKTYRRLTRSLRRLNRFDPMRRDEPVVIVGTGVALDREGLAAALLRRGVPLILVPVTGLGAWDAAVGWKRGIDFGGSKNRVGVFWPPAEVYICADFLRTEPPRVRAHSAAESIKYALVEDPELFTLWERFGPMVLAEAFQGTTDEGRAAARSIIRRSATGMGSHIIANALEDDLYKSTLIGHTLSQALEMAPVRRWWRTILFPSHLRSDDLLHGEAVALDILVMACISNQKEHFADADLTRLVDLFYRLGLPLWSPLLADRQLIETGFRDALKQRNGRIRLPLPDGIGRCLFADDISVDGVLAGIRALYVLARDRHGLQSPHQSPRRPSPEACVTPGVARTGLITLARRLLRPNPLAAYPSTPPFLRNAQSE